MPSTKSTKSTKNAKDKHKASSRWGAWSEWVWTDEYSTYYRVRQDNEGNYDYDYEDYKQSSASESEPRNLQTPIAEDGIDEDQEVDELAQVLEGQHLGSPHYTYGGGEGSTTSHRQSRGRDQSVYDAYAQHGSSSRDSYNVETPRPGYESLYPPPETPAYSTYDSADVAEEDGTAYGHDEQYEYGEDDNSIAPRSNMLDHRFMVHYSDEFSAGRILKVYWSEPKGGKKPGTSVTAQQTEIDLEGTIYTGFRRFIIIGSSEGHSTCIPILTYGGRACTKNGVKAKRHGIIYDARKKPKLLKHEPTLGYKPVSAQMYEPTETLSKESRVNYSKYSTIEHNARVWFVGEISQPDLDKVKQAYTECWHEMDRSHRKHRR